MREPDHPVRLLDHVHGTRGIQNLLGDVQVREKLRGGTADGRYEPAETVKDLAGLARVIKARRRG